MFLREILGGGFCHEGSKAQSFFDFLSRKDAEPQSLYTNFSKLKNL
ncbi:hypothetical protein SAMN05216297_110185 [Flavobacterium phragmitis]|uniref:Uncharacterized protein n=1 Tax=Flavobacterium phragmitis TaxID=739143 RepID=A0A1I1U471_9FLAO|nr:hypothetical protein SAMN05216297_110185 [Flavobacterium phragmitis]